MPRFSRVRSNVPSEIRRAAVSAPIRPLPPIISTLCRGDMSSCRALQGAGQKQTLLDSVRRLLWGDEYLETEMYQSDTFFKILLFAGQ